MRNPSSSSSSKAPPQKTSKATPCCVKVGMKKGPWTPEEDELLSTFINREGEGKWRTLPKRAGLLRCGKSCRLRWMNYLRPSVKRGHIAADEEDLILRLHRLLGNRWALIAGRIPGRTDNEIKNYWNTHLSKKLISQGIDPTTHKPLITTQNPKKTSPSTSSIRETKNQNKNVYFTTLDVVPENNQNQKETSNHELTDLISSDNHNIRGQQNNDKEKDIGYFNDDPFSFINSLINEDPFADRISALLSFDVPTSTSCLGMGNWESGIMSSYLNESHPKEG